MHFTQPPEQIRGTSNWPWWDAPSATIASSWSTNVQNGGAPTDFGGVSTITALAQKSPITQDFSLSRTNNNETGTIIWYQPGLTNQWTDYQFTISMAQLFANTEIGTVFRFQDAYNYYALMWFSYPNQIRPIQRRLRKVVNGVYTDLWMDTGLPMNNSAWYSIRVDAFGPRLSLYSKCVANCLLGAESDYKLMATVNDPNFIPYGTVGAITVRNQYAWFDNFSVTVGVSDWSVGGTTLTRSNATVLGYASTKSYSLGSVDNVPYPMGLQSVHRVTITNQLSTVQALQISGYLTNPPTNANISVYVTPNGSSSTSNLANSQNYYKLSTSRTGYVSVTILNPQYSLWLVTFYVNSTNYQNDLFNLNFTFRLYAGSDFQTLGYGTSVLSSVALNSWKWFALTNDLAYTNFRVNVSTPGLTQPYLRVAMRKATLPSIDSLNSVPEYDQITLAPNAAGSYIVTQPTPTSGAVYYIGIFAPADISPSSPTPIATRQSYSLFVSALPDAPSNIIVTPTSGATVGVPSVQISGDNLGQSGDDQTAASVTVYFNGIAVSPITWFVSPGTLYFNVPTGQGTGIPITVKRYGQLSTVTPSTTWNFFGPTVSSIVPANGPTDAGVQILVSGSNFGLSQTVTIGDVVCPVVPGSISSNQDQLLCALPIGQGKSLSTKMNVSNQISTNAIFFTYDAPSVLVPLVFPFGTPTAGQVTMVIRGSNFGTSGTVMINTNTPCPFTSWSHRQINCTLPAGTGTGNSLVVTVAGQSSTAVTFNYDKPSISGIKPANGSTEGGYNVTITGTNFGVPAVTTVVLNSVSGGCPIVVMNDSMIICVMPKGSGISNTLSVNVNGQGSNTFTFAFNAPIIASIYPANGPTQGGITITITGTSFGSSGSVSLLTVAGNTVDQCDITSHNSSTILCTLRPGTGTNKLLSLTVSSSFGAQTSNSVRFSYDAPFITAVNPSNGSTAGSESIEILGGNFGASGGSVTIDNQICSISIYGDFRIVCLTPAGQGTNKTLNVSIGGQSASTSFSYKPPAITALKTDFDSANPLAMPTGGIATRLTITGSNFGTGGSFAPVVTVGGAPCPLASANSHFSIVCFTPVGRGSNIAVNVTVAGQWNVSTTLLYYANPAITGVLPVSGTVSTSALTAGGQQVNLTITGTSFDTSGTVSVNSLNCPILTYSHTQITCQLPAGAGAGVPIVVTTVGSALSLASPYSYQPPSIQTVTPTLINTQGVDTLIITGVSLGPSGSGIFTVGGRVCSNPIWTIPHSRVSCTAPFGQGTSKLVVANISGQLSSNQVLVSYLKPTISYLIPPNGPTNGGYNLTLIGTNFGSEGSLTVTVANLPCPIFPGTQNHTAVVCTVPPSAGDQAVQITVSSQPSDTVTFKYDNPVIAAVTPSNGPTSGGTFIVLNGTSFGQYSNVYIGGKQCLIVSQTDGQINCTLPAGQGRNKDVFLVTTTSTGTLVSRSVTLTGAFNYDGPKIDLVDPNHGPTPGTPTQLTITGSNFGDPLLPEGGGVAYVGTTACSSVVSYTHFKIICVLPAGIGANQNVTVVTTGQTSNSYGWSYDIPVIQSINPQNATTQGFLTGTNLLTIVGQNFGLSTSSITVLIDNNACSQPQVSLSTVSFNTYTILCRLPVGQGANLNTTVSVAGQVSTPAYYSYGAPVIQAPSGGVALQWDAAAAYTDGGNILTINGQNFGTSGTVKIGSRFCTFPGPPATSYTQTQIQCQVPEGEGLNQLVQVIVSGQVSQQQVFYNYQAPTITNIVPSLISTNGTDVLVISGTSFGSPQASVTVSMLSINLPCAVTAWDHHSITCTAPSGTGKNRLIQATVQSQTSNTFAVNYRPPSISFLTAGGTCVSDGNGGLTDCPTQPAGTVTLTVNGYNFGTDGAKAQVTVNGKACAPAIMSQLNTQSLALCLMESDLIYPSLFWWMDRHPILLNSLILDQEFTAIPFASLEVPSQRVVLTPPILYQPLYSPPQCKEEIVLHSTDSSYVSPLGPIPLYTSAYLALLPLSNAQSPPQLLLQLPVLSPLLWV